MKQKSLLIKNVLSNYLAQFIYGASNFILVGYIVRKLGKESFGLVALLMSTIAIVSLLERGITRAVVKFIAEETENPDKRQISKYISTSFLWYLIAGLIGAGVMVVFAHAAESFFNVPVHLQTDAKIGWYLMGLRIALCFPFTAFQGLLHGYQRYDLVNAAHNTAIVLRLLGTIAFFEIFWASISALLWIAIASFVIERVMWVYFARRVNGEIGLLLGHISKKTLFTLIGFGTFVLINNVGNLLGSEAIKYVIGNKLSITDIGGYTLIATISIFAGNLVRSISSVLTPAASRFNSLGEHEKQELLLGLSTKYAMVVSGLTCIVPIFLLHPALYFWVGNKYSANYLATLAIAGGILLVGQWAASGAACILQMVIGLGRVRGLAIITLSWTIGGVAFVWLYLSYMHQSLMAAVIGITVARTLGSIANITYGLRILNMKAQTLLSKSVITASLIAAATVSSLGYLGVNFANLFRLELFLAMAILLFFIYASLIYVFVLSNTEKKLLKKKLHIASS